jgi:predicted metal-dependent phosphoesterase TrpH
MMQVDFHTHTGTSLDSGVDPERLVDVAVQRGLDALVICDHGHIGGALVAREVAGRTRQSLLVIVGEEVKTTEGEIIGLFLDEEINNGLTPELTVALIHGQGGVVVVPHPFDRHRTSRLSFAALQRISGSVDAIEGLNARTLRHADDLAARRWASERGTPALAGSDAHNYAEVGRARTLIPEFRDAGGLLAALPHARITGEHSTAFVHVGTALRKRLRVPRSCRDVSGAKGQT